MMTVDHTDALSSPCREMTEAMARQSSEYAVSDYFAVALSEFRQLGFSDSTAQAFIDDAIDSRQKMIQWMSQIVDYCHFTTETTEIAINCLDRYFASSREARQLWSAKHCNESERNQCQHEYQLAAVACLYIVVKVHEPKCLSPSSLADLSRGLYQPHDVERMERRVRNMLKWRVHLPTTSACIIQLIAGLQGFDETLVETCFDLAKLQVELAWRAHQHLTSIYTFSTMTLAAAAVQNALECLGYVLSAPLVSEKAVETVQGALLSLLATNSSSGKTTVERSRWVCLPSTVISSHCVTNANLACFCHSPRSSSSILVKERH
jgi:Cyclin, N-terminal domain